TPTAGSPGAYGLASTSVTIGGTVQNTGSSPITSFTVKYSDGVNTYSDVKSGLNIASYATYNFTHNTPYMIPAYGHHPINVWVELPGDNNHQNDSLPTDLVGVLFIPNHKVVFEEAT